jgi:hypothetical protein
MLMLVGVDGKKALFLEKEAKLSQVGVRVEATPTL